ncbi:MAG: NADP-dependent oxidoreductase [Solirubrobacterales bacterium]
MPDLTNRRWCVAGLPDERLGVSHFSLRTVARPTPADGQVLCRVLWISIDAAGRAWLQADTYRRALQVGDTMPGFGIGQVVESDSEELAVGDIVTGDLGWQEYAAIAPAELERIEQVRPLSNYLSVLGITGLTAYFGLREVGEARSGETVVVSAAAGATGTVVGQIARREGCRVVGICGSAEKGSWLTGEMGFDAAVSHRDPDFRKALRAACPDGVHVYFDNVAGPTLETMLGAMAPGGRIVCCGVVSQYDTANPGPGPRGVPGMLIIKSLTMRGFLLPTFSDRYAEGLDALAGWLDDGSIKPVEDIFEGLERAPEGLVGLLNGSNLGKRMVHVDDPV